MASYKVTDVFVPGGLPKYTYVPRRERGLEEHIRSVSDNLCKIATVTGPTKSGKTVMVRTVFKDQPTVWIEGGAVSNLNEFIELVADHFEIESAHEESSDGETTGEFSATLEAEGSVILAKAKGAIAPKIAQKRGSGQTSKQFRSVKARAIAALKQKRPVLVIDDFHYIPRAAQGDITRLLKPLVFEGVPVIYLAIPHRRYDAVKVEREMNGRIEPINVPSWDTSELVRIAQLGFPLLNITPHLDTSGNLAFESNGSPHLMQDFCRKICQRSGIHATSPKQLAIVPDFKYSIIYNEVAQELAKNIFDKLAKGPRARTDRKQRVLKDKKSADIYRVVLLALAHLKPGVATIEYERLRGAIREILHEEEHLPQVNEVTRVLEQMAKIASLDEISVPVIDYEKDDRRLHITDPFFAFFLKWGRDLI